MAARPYWRGQIRLALVSIPVEIFSATKSGAAVAFHQIYEPTGQRIKYEKTVPGIGPVDVDKIIKGFEYEKGEYVLRGEIELDARLQNQASATDESWRTAARKRSKYGPAARL